MKPATASAAFGASAWFYTAAPPPEQDASSSLRSSLVPPCSGHVFNVRTGQTGRIGARPDLGIRVCPVASTACRRDHLLHDTDGGHRR